VSNQSILKTIEDFWTARATNNAAALQEFLAPGATFEMVGAGNFAEQELVGPAAAAAAAERLVKDFIFQGRKSLTSIVEDNRAAMVSRLEVSYRGKPAVTTECCDFWEFDEAGKVKSLRQFVDTNLVRRMIAGEV
jgi:hypothetical protein